MSVDIKRENGIVEIEQLAVRLMSQDIDSTRAGKRRDHLPAVGHTATNGYIALGRRVRARAADGTVVSDTLEIARNSRRSSPQAILSDLKHHQVLNKRMEDHTRDLKNKAKNEVREIGDFVPAGTESASWYNSDRFGHVRIDEYVLLDALAHELTAAGHGDYGVKLALSHTMPGDWLPEAQDEREDVVLKEKSKVIMPPDWVSVVGLGEGDQAGTGCIFNERAQIAFLAFGNLRFEGMYHEEAAAEALNLATNLETTLKDASMYLVSR